MLGQSPEPYKPEFTQLVNGSNVEHVRKGPEGLVGNDATNDRAIWGYQKDGFTEGDDFGFKISRKGVRVQDATDDELIMSSAFNLPKIVVSDTMILTPPAVPTPGSTFASYTHGLLDSNGLPYIPGFMSWWVFDGLSYLPMPKYWFTAGGALAYSLEISVTATTLDVEFFYRAASPSGYPGPINIKFYLFRETAS